MRFRAVIALVLIVSALSANADLSAGNSAPAGGAHPGPATIAVPETRVTANEAKELCKTTNVILKAGCDTARCRLWLEPLTDNDRIIDGCVTVDSQCQQGGLPLVLSPGSGFGATGRIFSKNDGKYTMFTYEVSAKVVAEGGITTAIYSVKGEYSR
jgi:hypothetical protein